MRIRMSWPVALQLKGVTGATGPTGPGNSVYNDAWIKSNFIDPPPFITFDTVYSTSTEIIIPWTYPTQQPIGLITSWVPVINTLTAQFSFSNSVGPSTSNVSTLLNVSTGYVNYHDNSQYVTGIVLSKQSGANGVQSRTFSNDASPRFAYVYYNTNLANIVSSSTNLMIAWYANTNSNVNKASTLLTLFLTAGPPGVPRSLAFASVLATTLTFSYIAPLYVDINDPSSLLTITNYTITYSSTGSTIRYGGAVADSTHTVSNSTSLSYPATSLYPDSPYTFTVAATNSANQTGSEASSNVTTSNLTPSAALSGSLVFAARYYSNGTIKNILTGVTKTALVNATTTWTSSSFVTPIHSIAGRGSSSGSTLMTLTASIVNNVTTTTGPSITFSGFPSAGSPSAGTANYMTVTPTVTDKYAAQVSAQQGFYLQSANTVSLLTGIFVASQYDYVLTAATTGTFTGSATFTFQYDTSISTAPTVSGVTFAFSGTPTSAYISGVKVIYGTPAFSSVATATNMGNYYYSSPLLSYTGAIAGSWSPSSETDLTAITSGLSGGAFTTGTIVFTRTLTSASLASTYTNSITLSATANNIYSASSSYTVTPISAIVDGPSYTLVYSTLSQTIASLTNGTSVAGFRVASATAGAANVPPFNASGTSYASTAYDNTADISSLQELQVSNGKFTTPTGPGQTYAYKNYTTYYYTSSSLNTVNYSSISATGYRYATFAWRVAAANPNVYTTLAFRLYNTSGVTITNNLAYAGSTAIRLFYRIEDTASSAPTNTSSYSSAWINGNLFSSGDTTTTSGNYFIPTTYTDPTYSGLVSPGVTNVSPYTNFPVFIPPLNISSQTINIYCRIGIPMSVNFSFSHVTAVLSY